MSTEIAERYKEQLQTTAETLRRRFVSYYDGVVYAGTKVVTVAERAKEVAEPVYLDSRDAVTAAVMENSAIDKIDKDIRNNIVEMYLGLSVIIIGLASGKLSGAFALPPILEMVFDRYVEVALLLLTPIYLYYNVRKNAAMDDVERRTCLFAGALSLGVLYGHLVGPLVASLAPATVFITPMVYALLMDNELLVTPLASMERHSFLLFGGAIVILASAISAIIPLGGFSFGVALMSVLHVAFTAVHLQLVIQTAVAKTMLVGESQLSYILGTFFLQVICDSLFGTSSAIPSSE